MTFWGNFDHYNLRIALLDRDENIWSGAKLSHLQNLMVILLKCALKLGIQTSLCRGASFVPWKAKGPLRVKLILTQTKRWWYNCNITLIS